jgi:hypothetical protein
MKRTPLAKQSPKRRKENATYTMLRRSFMLAHPFCEACKLLHPRRAEASCSTELHHMHGRGINLNRVETWAAVCSPCHLEIHAAPNKARKLGLLK